MVNVVVVAPSSRFGLGLGEENMKKIAAVSKEVNLKDASNFLTEEQKGDASHKKEFDAILADADVLVARSLPKDVIKRAPKLKWIQMTFAGMESIVKDKDLVASPVKLTNASGIQAPAISEYVVTLMLAFNKHLPEFAQLKREKGWQSITMVSIQGQTVGILGFGNIGKEIAKRSKALGMKVIAYDRPRKLQRARNVDKLVSGTRGISEIFKSCDFVVSALPSTPETAGLIGEKQLKSMKPSAYLINISRGAVIDEPVLIKALKEKWIAGAGLDVFATEPLPKESELWNLPNTILSPHCCGRLDDTDSMVVDLFCVNLKKFMAGRRLINQVDKKAGF
jgi:phosphoglycerate dehydrogenase-like enzyme